MILVHGSAPGDAPARPDLDWLRHRTRRVPAAATRPAVASDPGRPAAPAATAPGPGEPGGSAGLADFLAGRTTRRQPAPRDAPAPMPSPAPPPPVSADPLDLGSSGPDPLDLSGPAPQPRPSAPAPAPAAPQVGDPLDLSPPTPAPAPGPSRGGDLDLSSSDLDLSGPTPTPTTPRPSPDLDLDLDLDLSGPTPAVQTGPPSGSSDLDLSGPTPAAQTGPPPGSSDLDLFPEPPAAPQAPVSRPARAPRPAPVARAVPRVAPGGRVILTPREPTVTLSRVQSGVGALTITAVCSPAVGDLVLGAVHQLADGSSGVVSHVGGIPTAPPRSRRPVLEGSRGEFEQIRVDLRQARSLRRFVVYAQSASEGQLAWGGTLVVTTHGGSRVEVPLDLAPHAGPVVLVSVHVVDGEFVVRAELEPVRGLVRDVALAHGFRAITWADARTPVL